MTTQKAPPNIPITSRPLFSILHTSARPDKWKEIYDAWMGSCKNPSAVEYVLCVDERWGFDPDAMEYRKTRAVSQAADYKSFEDTRPGLNKLVWNNARRCYVDGVNTAAQASTGIILIVNADDQYPCQDWDVELIKLVPQCTDFAISVTTGTPNEHERGIMVMPILSRPYYEKRGHVFYPAYESMYADNDFYECAVVDKVLVDGRHLIFPHRHPLNDPDVKVDRAYEQMNRQEAYDSGHRILETRRQSQFGRKSTAPGKPIVMEARSTSRKRIGVALPGEHFSSAWVSAWTELLTYLMSQFAVEVVFSYSSSVYATRQTIWDTFRGMRPQPDYLLWIDDDNIVTPQDVMRLLSSLESDPRHDIVAGWCWIAADVNDVPAKASVGVFDNGGVPTHLKPHQFKSSKPVQIGFTGFPVVLMRGELLEAQGLTDSAFAPVHSPVFKGGYTGEDVSFCIRATKAGATILVDSRVKVPHLKLRSAEPLDLPEVEVTGEARIPDPVVA